MAGDAVDAASLIAFSHYLGRPDAGIDLARAALLLAEGFEPGLDVAFHAGRIERIGDEARRRLAGTPGGPLGDEVRARRLLRLLYTEIGFRGNRADYYDPRNSFLHEVLDRRLGIPITLAVIVIEVARQAGLTAEGVAFPGHFLVRLPGPSARLLVDPFDGRILDDAGVSALKQRAGSGAVDYDPLRMPAASTRQIVARMLANLRGIYQSRDDRSRLKGVLERLVVVAPEDRGVAQALAALSPPAMPDPPSLKN